MVKIMHRAMSVFYLCEISSVTFVVVCNKLLGLGKLAPFQNIYLMDQLPAIFNDLFIY